MRILISRLSALGDVVCTLPVAEAIKNQWSDSEVTWVVDKRFKGIVECCRSVNHVVDRPRSLQEVKNLGRFDAALDMQGLLKSGAIVAAANAREKLGYHWQREGTWLFSKRVLPDPTSLHVVDQYADVARALGADCERASFGLSPFDDDLETVQIKLHDRDAKGKIILINAGAGWATKRWNPEKYAQVADHLTALGHSVVFLGAPADRTAFDEVRSFGAQKAIDMIGETNVRQLIALVALSQVHIGGDTGSTHIAAALGVPAVGIYTLTRLERSCPYGQRHNCFQGDPSVEEVITRSTSILDGNINVPLDS